jgi:hypothetical protein
MISGGLLRRNQVFGTAILLLGGMASGRAHAQQVEQVQQAVDTISANLLQQDPATSPTALTSSAPQDPPAAKSTSDNGSSKPDSPQPKMQPDGDYGKQTKRILWIVPNFKSVSANTQLPPLSIKEKFWLATQDSFDYSSVIYSGLIAGTAMAGKSEPDFGQGAAGYGRYFAHTFADGAVENFMVEAIVPTLTREDPRYYTLGHGGFFKRSGYAVSRLFITRTNSGGPTVNVSELAGAGAAAGISEQYYPSRDNQFVKTYQRWISQIIQDGVGNVAKEFWPDINRAVFHNKY